MITLQKLKWSNCFSFGPDNEVQFTDSTLTQIIGVNGAGKSSIPLILEEVLFNKNSKGVKKGEIANRHIDDGYSISLYFSVNSKDYEIHVNRKSSLKVQLLCEGEDISSHTATNTYKTIQGLIGMDFKTFSQIVYQNTNSSLQFLTATDTNRKKFLIDLLHLERYVRIFEYFKNLARELNAELKGLEARRDTVENWLNNNRLTDTIVLPMLEQTNSTEKLEKELSSLMSRIDNISESNKKIIKNNRLLEEFEQIDIEAVKAISATELLPTDSIQSKIGELNSQIATAKKLVAKMEGLGNSCPTCSQDIKESFKESLIKEQETSISIDSQKLAGLRQQITEINKNNELFRKKKREQSNWEDLYRSIDFDLPRELYDKAELEREAIELSNQLKEVRAQIHEIARENEQRTKRNTRIQVIQEQTEEFESQLSDVTSRLAEVQELSANVEILKKSFSTNGLLAYKIENLVKELEELTNHYLAELSDGKFTLEFIVTNDKLNVHITDDGDKVDIAALSSGQLARVNTATLLAIRKLMSSISKSKINVLFLDEVINVLDETGRERLVEVLLSEEDLNTYIVSHGWTHPLLSKVEVVQDSKISRLELQ